MMFRKTGYLLAALVCLSLVAPSLSCQWITLTILNLTNKPPLELRLDKAPRINEPVELTCIRRLGIGSVVRGMERRNESIETLYEKITISCERQDLKTSRMDLEVSPSDLLVDGNFDWEAEITVNKQLNCIQVSPKDALAQDYLELDKAIDSGVPLKFSAIIEFPKEGNWGIVARSTRNPFDSDSIFLNVAEESSSFGWMHSYAPYGGCFPDREPDLVDCIITQLDIAKPPQLNEPVLLNWSLNSIKDVDGVTGEVTFRWMKGTTGTEIPAQDVLSEGNLFWYGSLAKDSPLNFSATITFPREGDWAIRATSRYYLSNGMPRESGCVLYLHVDKKKGIWGWTESHESKPSGTLPPPLPTPLPPSQNNTDM